MSFNTTILSASVAFVPQRFARPLVLSSGTIDGKLEARATVRVRVGDHEGEGCGAILLSDLWAWPDAAIDTHRREAAMRALCERVADELRTAVGDPAHPLELGLRLHRAFVEEPSGGVNHPVPSILARGVCVSPFDAAIHDAVGRALNVSAFRLYDEPTAIPSADALFPGIGACRAVKGSILTNPRRELDAWVIIGSRDVLPDDLRPWVVDRGYRCIKLKVGGKDVDADVSLTIAAYRAAKSLGVDHPRLSIDSNEGNPDVASVIDYLDGLRRRDAEAYESVAYLEQPTARDIIAHPHDLHPVAHFKPVMLDEGLTGPHLLPEAVRQGWSGLAIKTCKGHSVALICAAWALRHGLSLTLQDLTNPGVALIHGALLAAHLPTLNGAELNSPQFCPEANQSWRRMIPQLFEPSGGSHVLPPLEQVGLGFAGVGPAP